MNETPFNFEDDFYWDDMLENWDAFDVFTGEKVLAEYSDQVLPMYRDNPLIEALPKIRSEEEFYKMVTYHPDYLSEYDYRSLPPEERLHMIMSATEFFEPFSQHAYLEGHLSRIIRMGYRHRSPIERGFWKRVKELRSILSSEKDNKKIRSGMPENMQLPDNKYQLQNRRMRAALSKMLGFTLLGISGIGKTVGFEAVLSIYPQVIFHQQYKGEKFRWAQIVWLKLDCPFDASIKGLCLNFFMAVDNILGTHYFHRHAQNGRATVDMMIPRIAHLAYIHSIGILVIDEVQRLSLAKSNGSDKMLSFFVQMINTARMPIVLVGTPQARTFVSSTFPQIRRGIGNNNPYWENMKEDEEWDAFCDALWRYQFTVTETPLTAELRHRLYYESAGIADLAVKLYILAQSRAIRLGGDEIITEDLIASVAHDSLVDAQHMLEAVRNRNYHMLQDYQDLLLIDGEKHNRFDNAINPGEVVANPSGRGSRLKNQKTSKTKITSEQVEAKKSKFSVPEGSLLQIVEKAQKYQVSTYEALQMAGYIKPITEFTNSTW